MVVITHNLQAQVVLRLEAFLVASFLNPVQDSRLITLDA